MGPWRGPGTAAAAKGRRAGAQGYAGTVPIAANSVANSVMADPPGVAAGAGQALWGGISTCCNATCTSEVSVSGGLRAEDLTRRPTERVELILSPTPSIDCIPAQRKGPPRCPGRPISLTVVSFPVCNVRVAWHARRRRTPLHNFWPSLSSIASRFQAAIRLPSLSFQPPPSVGGQSPGRLLCWRFQRVRAPVPRHRSCLSWPAPPIRTRTICYISGCPAH